MKTFSLNLVLESAAFDEDGVNELARILRGVAFSIETIGFIDRPAVPVKDVNGNTVGSYDLDLTEDSEEDN